VAYVLLQPGSEVSRVFSLRRLVLPDPTREERSLVLQAYYRNCSSGRRVGMEDVFVGWLVSRDLVLEPHDR
jgi:hypothetical protein